MEQHSEDVLDSLRKGDEEAVNRLFERFFAPLCVVAYRIVQDRDVAKDVVQDVFVRLWTNRNKLHITSSLHGYLKQSVVNASIDHTRKAYEQRKAPLADTIEQRAAPGAPDQETEHNELRYRIEHAISRLPERCRLVFVLSRYEHMTYAQIADTLKISTKTVENQMSKALKTLRMVLKNG